MVLPKLISTKASDWSEISSMMKDFCLIDGYEFDETVRHDLFIEFISKPHLGRLWSIKIKEGIAGYIIVTFGFSFEYGQDAFIDEVFIKDKFRGQGIGSQILKLVEKQSKLLGVKTVHLEVEEHNKTATSVYLKGGFKSNNRILMSKTLE